MDRPFLVLILTADLHCLKSIPTVSVPPCREALSRALTTRYFFLAWTSRERAISTMPAIKELNRGTSGILSLFLVRDYLLDIYDCH